MAKKKDFRHDVRYVFRGETRYGVVSMDKPKVKVNVVIDDAVLPFRVEVKDDANVVDIESSWTKGERPVYDRMTGLLVSGGNEMDKWVNAQQVAAEKASKAAGKGVVKDKLFSIGVADGQATYVVTKVSGSKCDVEWRGFGNGDRYTDHFFGYGKKGVKVSDVARYIGREESMADLFASIDQRDRAVFTSRNVGDVVHYVDGYFKGNGKNKPWSKFVRYEVIEQDGEKVGKFVGICGDWPEHSLPHITSYGEPYIDYDLKHKLDNPIVTKLCASKVYETATGDTPDLKRSEFADPRTLPLIDLTMPAPTAEQLLCKRVNDAVQAAREALNKDEPGEYNSVRAMRRLANAYKAIRAELMNWTVDDLCNNSIKDQTLVEQASSK
jgi:hypothetical protein